MKISEMEDLIYLTGPLTEDAVMKSLQARFNEKKFFVRLFFNLSNGPFTYDVPLLDRGGGVSLCDSLMQEENFRMKIL